jgi:hypothetical protein
MKVHRTAREGVSAFLVVVSPTCKTINNHKKATGNSEERSKSLAFLQYLWTSRTIRERHRCRRSHLLVWAAIALYTGAELPVITVTDAIMKRAETAYYRTATVLKEIKTVNLGYSGASHGVSIPLPIKVGGFPIRYRVGQSRPHRQTRRVA